MASDYSERFARRIFDEIFLEPEERCVVDPGVTQ